jgi:acetyl esterase/lipase
VRIYQYKDGEHSVEKQPLYIHLHGGGFMFGSLAADDPLCYKVAARLKMTVFSINYRHSPEFVYPTQVHDVWDAVNWAFENLGNYKVDMNRVVMGGISAGANLTAATAVMELDEKVQRIKGLLLAAPLCGPADQTFPYDILSHTATSSYVQNANAPVLSRQRVDFFLDNYKVGAEDDRYFNVMKLSDDELGQLGHDRAYFMICGLDPFRDEGIVWRERLSRAGKETRMQLYPGLPHGLGLGYVREDVFPPKHRWDNDYVDGVSWLVAHDTRLLPEQEY